ncbi:Zona pellucida sperm-binding protein 3 receptor Sperm fertilization protein 56 [Channa argus]|uniref:Zona pellucida sperm-binding protein 3 receptor Sperm fertilization protein 56 n=1 Tax=Channa argus TaxID=215402 RepID=A0A6G1Q3R5_CHAAH|nr:Zona pellucida sperm-binding protein 3 receptor Sperm fertilization protein 56 [Channa argus]
MGVTYFLLLSSVGLAVTVQAQNCSKPTLGPHMNLRDEFILLETFPDGTKVYLTCEVGYAPAGGSTVITCSAGSWSRVTLRCERKHCGSAGEITNGQVEYPEGTQFGDKALFHCDIGYTLVGNREIMCGDKGWMGRLPVCEVMICSPPHGVVNGTFSPNNDEYNYGDVVLYSCNKDNTLIGSRSITCSEDGTFKPEPPTCRMVECKDPQIVNGKWQTGSRPPHRPSSTVTLNCNSGYIMKGAATQTCEISGEWSPGLPTCERIVECKDPQIVNGYLDAGSRPPHRTSSTVTFKCNSGYIMKGAATQTCEISGEWSPGLPTCERMVECKDPQIVNGQWQAGSRPPHRPSSTVTFKCNSGYIMKGAATQTCEISGEWSPGLPTCELKSIPPSTTTTTTTPTTTTTTTAASTPKGGDSKLGPIVGVAVFGVILLLILVGVAVFIMKRKRSRRTSSNKEATNDDAERVGLS